MRRRPTSDGTSLRGPIGCCVLAVVALSLGPMAESSLRAIVRDAALPGYVLGGIVSRQRAACDFRRWPWTQAPAPTAREHASAEHASAEDANRLAAALRQQRALRVELASARRELAAYERSLGPVRRDATPTADVQRIAARVLRAAEGTHAGGILLDAGAVTGVEAGQITVEPLELAAGEEAATPDGAIVLAGAAVVGRTAEIGRWTSTLLPLTDRDFRAHVRLVRESEAGPVFGDEGILEGDGHRGCLVRYVPSTSSVAVGDHVYSFDPTGRLTQPLYYGRVVKAELRDGAPHWTIAVEPAADVNAFPAIHVLAPAPSEP